MTRKTVLTAAAQKIEAQLQARKFPGTGRLQAGAVCMAAGFKTGNIRQAERDAKWLVDIEPVGTVRIDLVLDTCEAIEP